MYKQPFSGNREWGWLINEAGKTELFTRAVDVARINKLLNLLPDVDTTCQQDTYYDIADATWVNLQEELEQWVIDNGGQANIKQPIAIKVDKEKIIELLTKEDTIDQIVNHETYIYIICFFSIFQKCDFSRYQWELALELSG